MDLVYSKSSVNFTRNSSHKKKESEQDLQNPCHDTMKLFARAPFLIFIYLHQLQRTANEAVSSENKILFPNWK